MEKLFDLIEKEMVNLYNLSFSFIHEKDKEKRKQLKILSKQKTIYLHNLFSKLERKIIDYNFSTSKLPDKIEFFKNDKIELNKNDYKNFLKLDIKEQRLYFYVNSLLKNFYEFKNRISYLISNNYKIEDEIKILRLFYKLFKNLNDIIQGEAFMIGDPKRKIIVRDLDESL